mgnify:CR=1 FL=1
MFTLSPDQKGIETSFWMMSGAMSSFTLSPDQKGIETTGKLARMRKLPFTLSPDQKGIETALARFTKTLKCSH